MIVDLPISGQTVPIRVQIALVVRIQADVVEEDGLGGGGIGGACPHELDRIRAQGGHDIGGGNLDGYPGGLREDVGVEKC